jgi:hypothetical protein
MDSTDRGAFKWKISCETNSRRRLREYLLGQ